MRTSHTVVVERNEAYTGDFTTEPYEAGWASEARWFVHLHEMGDCRAVRVFAQVSPDGLHWCDDGDPVRLVVGAAGLHSFATRDFGQWLRLRCAVEGNASHLRVTVTLALKG